MDGLQMVKIDARPMLTNTLFSFYSLKHRLFRFGPTANFFIFLQPSILLLILCLFVNFPLGATEVISFNKSDYRAASQNWSVAFDDSGMAYFGNSLGLLEFDGVTWMLHPSAKGTIIRCLAPDSGKVFTAGYKELGYWERNTFGELNYHSLTPLVEKNFTSNEEFWNVFKLGKTICFQSFTSLYVYESGRFEIAEAEGLISYSTNTAGLAIVAVQNKGLFRLEGHHLLPFLVSPFFEGKMVRFVSRWKDDDHYIIATESDGLYIYDEQSGEISPFAVTLKNYFRRNKINRALLTRSGDLVIGTILDGVVALDSQQQLIFSHNKSQGLLSNTVLGIAQDNNDNIWLALDRGISFICSPGRKPYRIFKSEKLGAVYSAALYEGFLYLGTNQGLYRKPWPGEMQEYTLLPQTQQQVWDCEIIDDQLFIGHNSGTFLVKDDHIRWLSRQSGGYSLVRHPDKADILIQSTYSDLGRFQQKAGQWQMSTRIQGFSNLIRFIEFDHVNNLWASHLYGNIYKLRLNDLCDTVLSYQQYELPYSTVNNKSHQRIFKVEGRLVFTSGEQLFTYNDLNDSIVPYTYLNTNLGPFASAHRIVKGYNHLYWFITSHNIACFEILPDRIEKRCEFPVSIFDNQLIPGYENLVPLSNEQVLVCLENGYAVINTAFEIANDDFTRYKPLLRKVFARSEKGKIKSFPTSLSSLTLPYNFNSLSLGYSFPLINDEKVVYQYKLSELNDYWSEPLNKPVFDINRIPSGEYTLSVRAINIWSHSSQIHHLMITVTPPWYKSLPATMVYALFAFALILLSRIISNRKLKLKKQRLDEENEKEIIKLKNERLQSELSFKSQQLASSTMGIIRKNEFLMNLKKKIKRQKENLGSRYPDKYYTELMEQIDENISGQDDWKLFETNFEEAHEAFLKSLKTAYPDLTASDLRLCAYLRINLTSKEIASMLGISVRGVENHRYRLRKKVGLSSDESLTDFILKW